MPVHRYNALSISKNPRYYSFKKKKNTKIAMIVVLVFFILFLTMLALPSLSNSICQFFSKTVQVIRSDLSCPDYSILLRQTLPGMEKEEGQVININPLLDYPKLLLDSELAGFAAIDTAKLDKDFKKADFAKNESETQKQQASPQEVVSYLNEREPQNPKERPLLLKEEGPLVLIYHTHSTESFLPESGKAFTQNLNETVVALGSELAEILENDYGIPVLHHKEVYDIPRDYAYQKARPEIELLLKENSSIQVVLDLHRDGVARRITTASINGLDAGRLLFVLGTRHEGWYSNLRFALFLQGILDEKYPNLSRGILKNNFIYNQNLHGRSLIVEIGGHENSLEEVKRSISYLAEAVASAFE